MFNSFIPYGKHEITRGDISSVMKVLKSQNLTQGTIVPDFEKSISLKASSKYVVALNSATSGLHLACKALGLGKNDYLWTSPISFVASANCGLYCEAKVDFVDINPSTGLISVESLKKKLKQAEKIKKVPKILVVVHLAGTSCEMDKIHKLSKQYGFQIVEDASHAIGASFNSHPVGSCKYSKVTIFSFHPVKIITTGEGGACLTNDKNIFKKIQLLRSHGIEKDPNLFEFKQSGSWSYEQQYLGYNYRMTDLQAALGINQLKRLEKIVTKRNEILENYKKLMIQLPIKFLEIPSNVTSSVHLAIIKLNNQDPKFHRIIFEKMRKNKIGVQLHYTPIHLQPFYRKLGFNEGNFPEAEKYSHNAFSIPVFTKLKFKQQKRIVDTLSNILRDT